MVELEYHLRQIESGFARILEDIGRGAVRVADLPVPLLLRAGQLIERYRVRPAHVAALTLVPELGTV